MAPGNIAPSGQLMHGPARGQQQNGEHPLEPNGTKTATQQKN